MRAAITWSDVRAAPREDRPRRWLADSSQRWGPWNDPELTDDVLETATDAQLAHLLNLLGWPVLPSWSTDTLGPWTGGTHWP